MTIKKNRTYSFTLIILLSCAFGKLSANSLSYCDSIIKQGINAMLDKKFATALELLTAAQIEAKERHWYKQEFLSTNNIGLTYYFMLDYGEALNNYLAAYTVALKHLEPIQEMTVLNNIAILYSKEKNYEKANEYFLKAYEIATEKKELLRIGIYAANLGIVYNKTKELEKARLYINEALKNFENEPRRLLGVQVTLAQNYFDEQNIEASKKIAEKLLLTATTRLTRMNKLKF